MGQVDPLTESTQAGSQAQSRVLAVVEQGSSHLHPRSFVKVHYRPPWELQVSSGSMVAMQPSARPMAGA